MVSFWKAAFAILAHLTLQFRRYWTGRILTTIGMPLLYLGGLGLGMGALVDRSSGGIGGVSYVQFVAPGVLCVTALSVVVSEVTYPVVGALKWRQTYFGVIATPLEPKHIVAGVTLFAGLSAVGVSAGFMVVAALLGAVVSLWSLLAVLVASLGGLAFGMPVLAFSSWLVNDQLLTVLMRFVVMPMTLFSATFFPLNQLPTWIHPLAWATPLWHAVEVSRSLTLGTLNWLNIGLHCLFLVTFSIGGYLLSCRLLRRRMVV